MNLVQCLTHSGVGGGQQVVYTLVRQLCHITPALEITVVLPEGGPYTERFMDLGVDVVQSPLDTLSGKATRSMAEVIRARKPSVVHSHGKGAGFHARRAWMAGPRYVHSYHGYHPPRRFPQRFLYRRLERYLLRKTDAVVNVSRSERDDVLADFPHIASRTTVIPNLIDRHRLLADANRELAGPVEAFFDRHQHGFFVTMLGRNDPVKNYPLALAALREAMRKIERIAVVLVGVNPAETLFREFRRLYPQRVLLLPVMEFPVAILKRSHLLLMTSSREGSPLAVLEAQALGIPVVGTRVAGILDTVREGVDGTLCDQTPGAIAEAIIALADHHPAWSKLSSNALANAATWDLSGWAEKYLALYKELAAKAPAYGNT